MTESTKNRKTGVKNGVKFAANVLNGWSLSLIGNYYAFLMSFLNFIQNRDKLERTHKVAYLKDFYYKTYGKKIVAKFRTKAIQKFGDEFFR